MSHNFHELDLPSLEAAYLTAAKCKEAAREIWLKYATKAGDRNPLKESELHDNYLEMLRYEGRLERHLKERKKVANGAEPPMSIRLYGHTYRRADR